MTALAKRLVACKGWRWMPGMIDSEGWRYSGKSGGAHWWWHEEEGEGELPLEQQEGAPDLTDPGTLGCLLALVAQAYGVTLDDVHVVRTTGMVWSVWIFRGDDSSYRVATHELSRAEALVAALEAPR